MAKTLSKDLTRWTNERLIKYQSRLSKELEEVDKEIQERVDQLSKLIRKPTVEASVSSSKVDEGESAIIVQAKASEAIEGTCGAPTLSGKHCSSTDLLENGRCIVHQDDVEYEDKFTEDTEGEDNE